MAIVSPSERPLEPLLRGPVDSIRKIFSRFFQIIGEEFERKICQVTKVFNVDETSLCMFHSRQPDAVGFRGTLEVAVRT
jgi:hypothetical protein